MGSKVNRHVFCMMPLNLTGPDKGITPALLWQVNPSLFSLSAVRQYSPALRTISPSLRSGTFCFSLCCLAENSRQSGCGKCFLGKWLQTLLFGGSFARFF